MRPSTRHHHVRPGGFHPPHCPNPDCDHHRTPADWHFVRCGTRLRHRDGRRLPTFLCRHCRRRFSSATFSTSYWLKRPELLAPIAQLANEGAALRQIARTLGTTHATVARHLARLDRHGLLFHLSHLPGCQIREPLVVDGFESYAHSQFFPFHVNLAVGADTWTVYSFTVAPLRRKGAMTPGQKRKRAELEHRFGRPNPKAVELTMAALLQPLLPRLAGHTLHLHSDDHPAYPRALDRLRRRVGDCPRIVHHVTPSTVRRTQHNPLFPVNLTDLLIRHAQANHHRETIAFSKCLQGVIDRLATFIVWRNYIKKRREKAAGPPETVAMRAGLAEQPLTWRQILRRRLFPGRIDLTPAWRQYYLRQAVLTIHRGQPAGRVHRFVI
jgi:transposase-like protein